MASIIPLNVSSARGSTGLTLLIKEIDKLVSLPDIYYRIESIITDPASTTATVAKLLECDVDLSARLLRMANSAFYSFPPRIETIERAVATVGLRQIREMILVTTVINAFNGIAKARVDMSSFWEHSITVGLMARALARHGRVPGSDGFYIPGLLHDLGHLVMHLKLPELMHDLLGEDATQAVSLYQREIELLGYSHADVGASLLANWSVPASIYEPICDHHKPLEGGEFLQVSCAIHLADFWVASQNETTVKEQKADEIYMEEATGLLEISIDDLNLVGKQVLVEAGEIKCQFMLH
ncbi:MAG: HD-like signal output (HDOD) protein [Planctomycetota bacterium]|jgi:HD-like signal output (HDOD) protein